MGGCWSCLYRDSVPENHPTKFKVFDLPGVKITGRITAILCTCQYKVTVTNVDDEGNELGSGTMELTQTELILHTRKRDAVRWPYLCLRRYGYDSNLFSFESGRRCQTGQGIFAFKCSRAEEIFNLLQDLMQCNSINVVEEPVMITRGGHTPELELPCTPQTPNTPAYTVQGFPNGYPGYPVSADSSHPSSGQQSVADDHGHSLMGLDEQAHTYVNTASVEAEIRGRHCVHSLPEVRPTPFPEPPRAVAPSMLRCPLEEREDPAQVFLQPASQEAKFMLGPTPAQRRFMELRALHSSHGGGASSELDGPHPYHHHHHQPHPPPRPPHPAPAPAEHLAHLTYENVSGLRGGGRRGGPGGRGRVCAPPMSHSGGSSSSSSEGHGHTHPHPHPLPPQAYGPCERGCHRKTALLNYENLPSLPPVWEYRALHRDDEEQDDEEDDDEEEDDQEEDEEYEEEDYDEYEFSEEPGTPNGYHQDHGDDMRNYVNTERMQLGPRRPACPPRRQQCSAGGGGADGVFSFDFHRGAGRGGPGGGACEHGHLPQPRQLNYIQVDLDAESSRQDPAQPGQFPPSGPAARRSEFYAVIDLKKTAAMSNLQKALPRDDGTSRKTRHNSTDLPL